MPSNTSSTKPTTPTGLVVDKTCPNWPASIAAVGLGLTVYPIGVERGFITRLRAAERTLTTLRLFWQSEQSPEPGATGYKGFCYHFLDMQSGARASQCELSTVDSALLLAGMLTCAAYFDGPTPVEREIRDECARRKRSCDGVEGTLECMSATQRCRRRVAEPTSVE